jgi:acetate kinase
MDVFVINAGSSSIKFTLTRTSPEGIKNDCDEHLAEGLIERIGTEETNVHFEYQNKVEQVTTKIQKHEQAIHQAISLLQDKDGPLNEMEEIDAVGHRVVHGGESFSEPVRIDDVVERKIDECSRFAPLHNPHNLNGIRAARQAFPNVEQVACFDTAVHQSLPEKAFMYAIPRELYEGHGIRKYGFHGLSHRYIRMKVNRLIDRPPSEITCISCHLGNGCSVAAFDGNDVLDTSMGFTPLEGLVMGTRSGDLDPAIPLYLMEEEGYSSEDVNTLLNKESGLLGLSGRTNDMKTLIERAQDGDQKCKQAIDVFCHRLKKYICAYHGLLNGADALIFTGGIGEHAPEIRHRSTESLQNIGIELDNKRNDEITGKEGQISTENNPTFVGVIPTDEERMIARDTDQCLQS